jgi:hypothetical protein
MDADSSVALRTSLRYSNIQIYSSRATTVCDNGLEIHGWVMVRNLARWKKTQKKAGTGTCSWLIMQWEWEENNGPWTAFPDVDSLDVDATFLADLPCWLARSSGMIVELDSLHSIHVGTATCESAVAHRMSSIEAVS